MACLLLGLSCIPLGLIALDFSSFPLFSKAIIGGNGLADGVLLSTFYAFLMVNFLFSVLAIALIVIWQIREKLHKKRNGGQCVRLVSAFT